MYREEQHYALYVSYAKVYVSYSKVMCTILY